jgi:NADPH-dependent 2,4-dienoyl-CoA reductase/sulfur reductase-like enzyme
VPDHDVAIVGGGPAGLAAAERLAKLGIRDLVVLEREAEAGGIPRHCGHRGFGWQSHHRVWTGPQFARQMRQDAKGLDVRTGTTVLEIRDDASLLIRNVDGISEITAKRVLVATGTRETPRSARLVGGTRPQGVMNTGALQQHVYLQHWKPFERPLIVGSEYVSFSALLTCRHMGIRPVTMIEENPRITVPAAAGLAARYYFGVPVRTETRLVAIEGNSRVEYVEVEHRGRREQILCDGVVFTGQFRPENQLLVDSAFVFAAGNVLAPLKSSGACWQQGVAAADKIAASLR